MYDINLPLILIAAFVAGASPGPATLAIAGTSMAAGRKSGLFLAAGITAGSLMWSVGAALGLGAIMHAHVWVFEIIRYFGAAYLMFLAYKSGRSAFARKDIAVRAIKGQGAALFAKGFALHITNPKAILFFGALYSVGVPEGASIGALGGIIVAVGAQSMVVFHGYAFLFSTSSMTRAYMKSRRWFEAVFAVGFGVASLKIFTSRIQ